MDTVQNLLGIDKFYMINRFSTLQEKMIKSDKSENIASRAETEYETEFSSDDKDFSFIEVDAWKEGNLDLENHLPLKVTSAIISVCESDDQDSQISTSTTSQHTDFFFLRSPRTARLDTTVNRYRYCRFIRHFSNLLTLSLSAPCRLYTCNYSSPSSPSIAHDSLLIKRHYPQLRTLLCHGKLTIAPPQRRDTRGHTGPEMGLERAHSLASAVTANPSRSTTGGSHPLPSR